MSKLGDFDVNQLMLMLHGEMKQAFDATQDLEDAAKLRVDEVRLKIGQKEQGEKEAGHEKISLLDPERYPDEESWEINLSYRYGDPIPGHPGGGEWMTSVTAGLVLDRLKNIPVSNVKGIDRVWNSRFAEAGIKTLGDLASCPGEKIRQLGRTYRTLQPLEFQTLVLLLERQFTPLQYTEFHGLLLTDILWSGSEASGKLFKGKLSEPEIVSLKAMAAIICTVIDRKIYQNLRMEILAPENS
jgi:hypothetical protein